MSGMAKVSRPPSVHAPWRKSFIIPLFTVQLFWAAFTGLWGIVIGGVSLYIYLDSGLNDYCERMILAAGIISIFATFIVIAHIVMFARFWLTARVFLYGNLAVVTLSLVSFIISLKQGLTKYDHYFHGDPMLCIWNGVFFFMSLWMMVYAILVYRRVNSGRALDMARARPQSGLKDNGNGVEGGIPMV